MCDVWCKHSDNDFIADDKKQNANIQRDKEEEEDENKKSKGDKVPKTVSYL